MQHYLFKLVALVSDQDVQHAFVQKQRVEVVVAEEHCQLIGAQALLKGTQPVLCQLTGAAIQEVLSRDQSYVSQAEKRSGSYGGCPQRFCSEQLQN